MNRGCPGDDSPEPEVCGEIVPKPLVVEVTDRVELSLRSPARGGGMALRGGSARREPVRRGTSQTSGDVTAGTRRGGLSTGSITSTGHRCAVRLRLHAITRRA